MMVLRTEVGTTARATRALNYWAIALALGSSLELSLPCLQLPRCFITDMCPYTQGNGHSFEFKKMYCDRDKNGL